MRTANQKFVMRQTVLAIAVLAAIGQARAQMSEEVRELTTPDAWISVGAAGVTGNSEDRAQFGQFNGMREHNGYLMLDADYARRDNATGMWTTVVARNLGLDNREIRVGVNKQGDWKLFGEWNQITRHSPFTVNTGMLNVGSTSPQVVPIAVPGSGSDYDFKLERKAAIVGGEKWIFPNLKFEAVFKNETKEGNRLWGRGYDCANYVCGPSPTTASIDQTKFLKNAILMVPEPIDSVIRQIDVRLQFNDEKLNLTAAYYGNIYKNDLGSLSPIVPNSLYGGNGTSLIPSLYPAVTSAVIAGGGTSLQNVLQLPMSLQPDSQAHQFSLSGNYAFTPTTKATFKYAYTHATQDKDFLAMGLPGGPAGVTNLDGRVDSTAAQLGLTSRPIKDLSLLANVSYLRREDKTPNELYNVEAKAVNPATTPPTFTNVNQIGVPGAIWNNNHVSNTNVYGKLEASYRLPYGLRGTLGWDYHKIERLVPESRVEEALAGLGPLREENEENGWRVELRRGMSETLNGSISYVNSKRRGSDWTNLSTLDPSGLPVPSALNTYLINTYCGGTACYGQQMSAAAILGVNGNTPFPYSMADVNREKIKGMLDWTPFDRMSLQFAAEHWKDTNETGYDPLYGPKGWRDTGNKFFSLDATYQITDNWRATGYASYGDQTINVNHSTGYMAELRNKSTAVGLQLAGRVSGPLQVGANFTYVDDVNKYGIRAANGTTGDRLTGITVTAPTAANLAQAAIGLNDVTYRKNVIGVYGQYMLNKFSDVRVDVVYNKYKYDDWVWGGQNGTYFVYGDNTIVKQKVDQSVTLFALTYIYRFR
jgi:MtrB/PioB family decaheme-associated outer membrane protein